VRPCYQVAYDGPTGTITGGTTVSLSGTPCGSNEPITRIDATFAGDGSYTKGGFGAYQMDFMADVTLDVTRELVTGERIQITGTARVELAYSIGGGIQPSFDRSSTTLALVDAELTLASDTGPVATLRLVSLDSAGLRVAFVPSGWNLSMTGTFSDLATGASLDIVTTEAIQYPYGRWPGLYMDQGLLEMRDSDGTGATWEVLAQRSWSYTLRKGPPDGGTAATVDVVNPVVDPIVAPWPQGQAGACPTAPTWLLAP